MFAFACDDIQIRFVQGDRLCHEVIRDAAPRLQHSVRADPKCGEVTGTCYGVSPIQQRHGTLSSSRMPTTWNNPAMPIIAGRSETPKCFIAMPVTTRQREVEIYGGDLAHWAHVMEELFVPAIKAAGFVPVIPISTGAHLIHERIVKHLSECDLVLCDLSADNPNVFFEMGVRTSLDRPIALVWDGLTKLPFDTSGINTHKYSHELNVWEIEKQRETLTDHIVESATSCAGRNPLWKQFGLNLKAQEPSSSESPLEAKLDVLAQQVGQLAAEQRRRVPTRLSERLRATDPEFAFGAAGRDPDPINQLVRDAATEAVGVCHGFGFAVIAETDAKHRMVVIQPVGNGDPPEGLTAALDEMFRERGVWYRMSNKPTVEEFLAEKSDPSEDWEDQG